MSEQEKYVPSNEEMAKVEKRLTPTQADLSADREAKEPLRQRQRELNPLYEKGDRVLPESLVVTDQGHRIALKRWVDRTHVTIDGVSFNSMIGREEAELAKMLWEKYKGEVDANAKGFESPKEDIVRAQLEVVDQAQQFSRREAQKQEVEQAKKTARELLHIISR